MHCETHWYRILYSGASWCLKFLLSLLGVPPQTPGLAAPGVGVTSVLGHLFSPVPLATLKVGIAVELVAQPSCMQGLICRCTETEWLVELSDQLLHPLASADDKPGVPLAIALCLGKPSNSECRLKWTLS